MAAGHGYDNFMNNKHFHPANWTNLRKKWEAEQREKQLKQQEEEMKMQYQKEQEIYKAKELMGKAHPMSFMYDPPPGYKQEEDKEEEDQPKLKFDWKNAAARESRAFPNEKRPEGTMDGEDQPFGVPLRHVKCIKCGKWGHVNTDKLCPLYGKAKEPKKVEGDDDTKDNDKVEENSKEPSKMADGVDDLMSDGLVFKQCVRDKIVDKRAYNQQYVVSDDDDETEVKMMAQLSKKEKRRLLRKLERLEDGEDGERTYKKTKKHRGSDKSSKKHRRDCFDSESDSSDSEPERIKKSNKKHKRKRARSESNSPDDESEKVKKHKKHRRRRERSESDDSDSEAERTSKKKTNHKKRQYNSSPNNHHKTTHRDSNSRTTSHPAHRHRK